MSQGPARLRSMPELQVLTFDAHRRKMGFVIGAWCGVLYGIIAQGVNRLLLPGIDLYQPPLGMWGNTLLLMLVGAALGTLSAWPSEAWLGVLFSSLAAAGAILGVTLIELRKSPQAAGTLVGTFFLLLPLIGMIAPVMALLRLGAGRQETALRDGESIFARLRIPLLISLIVAAVAAIYIYRPNARATINEMDQLVRAGQAAGSAAELPEPLRPPEVGGFLTHAPGRSYTLEWTQRDMNRFRIPRPGARWGEHAIVLARFSDGWNLACLFVGGGEQPVCRQFPPLEA